MIMNYMRFKIRIDKAESLLHSINYYNSIIKAHGHPLTGAYARFGEELHDLIAIYKKREADRKQPKDSMLRRG
jgi:hypothetical protein